MKRTIYLARPRLDCSFKPGPVPGVIGPPGNAILAEFGRFLDRLEDYHRECGDEVIVETQPLWRFDPEDLRTRAVACDRLYFPHKLRAQFPIGDNVLYYKNAPLGGFVTVDPEGWGASLSFLPFDLEVSDEADRSFEILRQRLARNESVFVQPPQGARPVAGPYDLFICQLPHDETIQFHSTVGVAEALAATIAFCEQRGQCLVVKGHPANPRSMAPLRALANRSENAVWVDDISIHTCIAGAESVYLVNSGSGMEVLLHDRPLFRFGRAEYDAVVPRVAPEVASITALCGFKSDTRSRAAFLHGYLSRCIAVHDLSTFKRILDPDTQASQPRQ